MPLLLVLGFMLISLARLGDIAVERHLDDDRSSVRMINSCRGFCSVPGPLQTVQRVEFWEVSSCPESF